MTRSEKQATKAAFAPKMMLAALILFLPLVIIATLVVNDRNAQIDSLKRSIHGIEYVLNARLLLEQIGSATAALHADSAIAPAARHRDAVETLFDDIDSHLSAEADEFEQRVRIDDLRQLWRDYTQALEAGDRQQGERYRKALVEGLHEQFRYVGDRSGLSALPDIEAAYIARLVIRQVPEAITRIETALRLATEGDANADARDGRHHDYMLKDWSLTLSHNELLNDYARAAALDPDIAARLDGTVEAFDQSLHRFHTAFSSIGYEVAGHEDAMHIPQSLLRSHRHAAGAADAGGHEADGTPEPHAHGGIDELVTHGNTALAATFSLFDRAVSTLQGSLEARLRGVVHTKTLALSIVLGASLFATFAGWLLLRALTAPLEGEIATRKSAEQRARQLAAIVESSHDSILVISPDNIFTSWNRGAERLYGYRADEAIGQPTSLLAPPGLAEETPAAVQAALSNGANPTLETVRRRKNGSLVHVSLRTSPVYDEDGEITGVAVIGRNISARKKAEGILLDKERALEMHVAQLRTTQHELSAHRDHLEEKVRERTAEVQAQAEQLAEALTREKEFNALQRKFVSMASHEFRTPLAIIDGSAQRILRRADRIEPEDLVDRIGRIRDAVSRMLSLIESTLSMSRLEAGKVELSAKPLDIAALVREVCNRQQEISENHRIRFDLDALPDEIVGDVKLLDQVFTNLLSNAVKYAPESPEIDIVGRQEQDGIAISVRDRGRGIPRDELPNMFQRFYRASTSNGIAGTGIGLNLANEFVMLHGGSIAVESEVGVGTTFTVKLPLASQQAQPREPASSQPESDALAGVAA